jgi:hypothetical protein
MDLPALGEYFCRPNHTARLPQRPHTTVLTMYRTFSFGAALTVWLFLTAGIALGQPTVDPAIGAGAVSADDFTSGTWTTLTGPVITETVPGQLAVNGTIVLTAPPGWQFSTSPVPTITVELAPGFVGTTKLDAVVESATSTKVTVRITGSSSVAPARGGMITFSSLNVRPTTGLMPNSGNIVNTGTTAPSGITNFGTLTMTTGAAAKVRVETQPGGSGTVVGAQNRTAGSTMTVYAITRDAFNNFRENTASTWSLDEITGTLTTAALTPSGDGKSAAFAPTNTGSARIRATSGAIPPQESGTLTVLPAAPAYMAFHQQPSDTAVAGQTFPTQPIIRIFDQFDNLVTTDHGTQVTAVRHDGSGTLQGTIIRTASAGVATFTDLYHTVANTISIGFTSGSMIPLTSGPVTIDPAASSEIVITQQPVNTALSGTIIPPVSLLLRDAFGNDTGESGRSATATMSEGSGTLSGTTTRSSVDGLVLFNDLAIDEAGAKRLQFSGTGLAMIQSTTFLITAEGELATFLVEAETGGPIGEQEAGEPFTIRISAREADGTLVEEDIDVEISSDGVLSLGETTVSLVDGVALHTVALTSAGSFRVRATKDDNANVWGESDAFAVTHTALAMDGTEFTVTEDTLVADGASSTSLSIQLRDEFGNPVTSTHTVDMSRTGSGILSSVTYAGGGLYTATLTAPTTIGSAAVSATVDSNPADTTFTIAYVPGPVDHFQVVLDAGGDKIAGTPFTITVTARDAHSNIVTGFEGTATVTSTGALSAGGTTGAFTGGVLTSHPVTITNTGTFTLTVTALGQSGTSPSFAVVPGAPVAANSIFEASPLIIENDGTSTATISLQLRDAHLNPILTDVRPGTSVTINMTTGSSPLSALSFSGGTYSATLTSTTTIQEVTLAATVGGQAAGSLQVLITQFNRWLSANQQNRRRTWDEAENWSLGIVPTTDHYVIIPATPANGTGMPLIETTAVAGALHVDAAATLTVTLGHSLTIALDVAGEGALIGDQGAITFGRHKTITSLNAATSTVTLNGTGAQSISGSLLAGNLVISNANGTGAVTASDFVFVAHTLTVQSGRTMSFGSAATLETQNIVGAGSINMSSGTLLVGGAITLSALNIATTNVTFNGLAPQTIDGAAISGLREFHNLTISNSVSVSANHDLNVNGSLGLFAGKLIMLSGTNLVAPSRHVTGGTLELRREISRSGWHLITAPISTTYGDFFQNITTQGYTGSSRGAGDQPNVMFFDETFRDGTTNQRWRAPGNASDPLVAGRGLFFYVFGDVPADARYNDVLPRMLDVTGQEFHGCPAAFSFPVSYTSPSDGTYADSLDAGWNLVGNPFGATIDWCADAKWTKTNMDAVAYLWDGTEYLAANCVPAESTFKIAPFQAFWVKANDGGAPVLDVAANARLTGGVFQKQQSPARPTIALRLTADDLGSSKQITFSDDGRTGRDMRDGLLLEPPTESYVQLYSVRGDGARLSINNLPERFSRAIEFPLGFRGFRAGKSLAGEYVLRWPVLENIPDHWTIELVDRDRGQTIDLLNAPEYRFDDAGSGTSAPLLSSFLSGMGSTEGDAPAGGEQDDPIRLEGEVRFPMATLSSGKTRFTLRITPGEIDPTIPADFLLDQNYPNPFNAATTLRFGLPEAGTVRIEIYDALGRRVALAAEGSFGAGYHEVPFDATGMASGLYIARLVTEESHLTRRMLMVK